MQQITEGDPVNVHGTKGVGWTVGCPRDTDSDGYCDVGGCTEVWSYGEWTNWMTLYELDPAFPPWCGHDDLVETLYFPSTLVDVSCDIGWCSSAGSSWVTPTSGSVTYAEMAMIVNYGFYEDSQDCVDLRYYYPEYNCIW